MVKDGWQKGWQKIFVPPKILHPPLVDTLWPLPKATHTRLKHVMCDMCCATTAWLNSIFFSLPTFRKNCDKDDFHPVIDLHWHQYHYQVQLFDVSEVSIPLFDRDSICEYRLLKVLWRAIVIKMIFTGVIFSNVFVLSEIFFSRGQVF